MQRRGPSFSSGVFLIWKIAADGVERVGMVHMVYGHVVQQHEHSEYLAPLSFHVHLEKRPHLAKPLAPRVLHSSVGALDIETRRQPCLKVLLAWAAERGYDLLHQAQAQWQLTREKE